MVSQVDVHETLRVPRRVSKPNAGPGSLGPKAVDLRAPASDIRSRSLRSVQRSISSAPGYQSRQFRGTCHGVKSDIQVHSHSGRGKPPASSCFAGQQNAIRIFRTKWESACASRLRIRVRPVMSCRWAGRLPGRGAMSGPPPGRVSLVLEAERIDPEVTGQYRYRTMRRAARMTSAIDRM